MDANHYIEKCKHGLVLSQCRCPGPRTEYIMECPPECDAVTLRDQLRHAEAEIERLRAERDRAREVAVWAVRHCIGLIRDGASIVNDDYTVEVEHDGTDAGILAALEAARGRE